MPLGTLLVNLSGAMVLGFVIEALVRSGDDHGLRRSLRLLIGTGLLGAFTTYSSFIVQTDLLVRSGRTGLAALYVLATLLGGLLATSLGITLGGLRGWWRAPEGPIDPDPDVLEASA